MLDILFVTDFVCPYCLVAKVALEEALRADFDGVLLDLIPRPGLREEEREG